MVNTKQRNQGDNFSVFDLTRLGFGPPTLHTQHYHRQLSQMIDMCELTYT